MKNSSDTKLQSIDINNEPWFMISDFDSMRPFFMTIVSDSNHWMFISSNGGVSAGRKNSEYALFPYYTDDKLVELAHTTGSKTVFQVESNGSVEIWEPFCDSNAIKHSITRNLYKNRYGNKIMFEEVNNDLKLSFKYQWSSSDKFGFVKTSVLSNFGDENTKLRVLDGIQNIMPYGVNPDLQTRVSNLVDAYKRSELVKESGLGIYALSAIIVDKAEPSEALKANVVWSLGLKNSKYLLSSLQLDRFKAGHVISEEEDVKGEKGAYFIHSELELKAASDTKWFTIANVNQTHAQIIELNKAIKENSDLEQIIIDDVQKGTENLLQLIAGSDGLQLTQDSIKDSRHYSNVLFNIMRGGTFDDNYQIDKTDFIKYLENASKDVAQRNEAFINELDEQFDKAELNALLTTSKDVDLVRLGKEYLPLKFSRRHGDPSRPWNRFSINTHSEVDGSKILDYEGNWRDIFQNWEALAHSYPAFVEGMIFKFLNATTFDGYNPYRVTKGGFDWEIIEPDDPWSYIGYWGDHQIIYLLKFLEFYQDYKPEEFSNLFDKNLFVYANVPYRIKSYDDIAKNPKDTIEFDEQSDHSIREKVEELGADGSLLASATEGIHHVNFLEKILATVLSKVSNFIPEAGIWMNTQRPEWNDANNALVGNGVSMVTLYYLRRFLKFLEPLVEKTDQKEVTVSNELRTLFEGITNVLDSNISLLSGSINDSKRRDITEGLGKAGSRFREQVYNHGFSGEKSSLDLKELKKFINVALQYLEHSIRANKRADNLYHAYNLMSYHEDGIRVSYLDEMLEGQTAVLSSKYLSSEEALKVLDALRTSSLYREDQHSYILYPNKQLPGFLEKNSVSEEQVKRSELLQGMISNHDHRIISKDVTGGYHFNGNFKNASDVKKGLLELESTEYSKLAKADQKVILDIFEEVFNHKAFTGRSGTFFAFEGLGSIYWHMVSKLHLAVMEVCLEAANENVDASLFNKLGTHFDEIGEGIGMHKSPSLYGAFPTDPYSHTPYHKGAQQPGMTGQVKEDLLVRFGELGLKLENGKLQFSPVLLKKDEFSDTEKTFDLKTLSGDSYSITMPANAIGFTYCQVPIIYQISENEMVTVSLENGDTEQFTGLELNNKTTEFIHNRNRSIKEITVSISGDHLR